MKKSFLIWILFFIAIPIWATEYVPGVLIVKMRAGNSPISSGISTQAVDDKRPSEAKALPKSFKRNRTSGRISASSASLDQKPSEDTTYVLKFAKSTDMEAMARTYSSKQGVIWAEPNFKIKTLEPTDDGYKNYNNTNIKILETELVAIQKIPITSEVVVAVLDGGIDYTHPYLTNSMATNSGEIPDNDLDDDNNGLVDDYYGYNFYGYSTGGGSSDPKDTDTTGHGTHVAGIIAAQKNDEQNMSGVNPGCKLVAVKFKQDDDFTTSDEALAIRYAVDRGAKIINCSFNNLLETNATREAFQYAFDNGVIVVCSAGNTGEQSSTITTYPALYHPNAIVVAGMNIDGTERVSASNYGSIVDFAEYYRVYSTIPGAKYEPKGGTSMSCPIVVGIIARLLGNDPTLTKDEIMSKLTQYSQELADGGTENGHGKILCTELAASYTSSDTKYVDIDLAGKGRVVLEIQLVRDQSGNVQKKIMKYLYTLGKKISINKEF